MDKLSAHILIKEATFSDMALRLGIDNTPNATQMRNMAQTATHLFEPLREGLGSRPIRISSFFRSEILNRVVGGAKNSQHTEGSAVDLDTDGFPGSPTNMEIFNYIKDNLEWDQLILEFPDSQGIPQWIHCSYSSEENRRNILISRKIEGKTRYENFI